jgi:predicted dinucleotide-binding enzyme
MIGSTVGKLWIDAGHEVRFASRHPETLQPLVKELGARASAGSAVDAAKFGEVVLLSVPLASIASLAAEIGPLVSGKVVLDTGNAYANRDGAIASEASAHPRGSAGWAATMFSGARWVKAFNTVYYKTLASEAHRKGDKVGIPLASDDAAALEIAARLVSDAGFDAVPIGELSRGREFEPGTRPYNTGKSGAELRKILH